MYLVIVFLYYSELDISQLVLQWSGLSWKLGVPNSVHCHRRHVCLSWAARTGPSILQAGTLLERVSRRLCT